MPKISNYCSDAELLTNLNNRDQDYDLEINSSRTGIFIGGENASVNGLECNDIKCLCVHPNLTDDWNHFMVVMDQAETVNVRKVTFQRK